MRESIHKYFQIGTIQWMSYPPERYDLIESVGTICANPFFSVLEVTSISNVNQREMVKHMLEQSHMRVCFGAQPILMGGGLNPNDVKEEKRKQAEDALKEAIDQAELIGAGGIAFMSGHWDDENKEKQYQQLCRTTEALCSYAGQKNMTVELEVFDYDMDKKALIGPAPLAARFAADIRCKYSNFGLLADLSHFPTTYEDTKSVIRTMRPYLTHFHIGNAVIKPECEGYGDQHPRFGFPNGANDVKELKEFFTVLKEEGFFCQEKPYVLSIEVKPRENEAADLVLAGTIRTIQRAWALLED
ncbi:MAG TPA: TIM barrel protein [Candidatus Cottocaccamicrobium excrementipullorum]|nr:TIM barrel protein [Candidatus Cottocaccamicrobium excrementipullorum]